MTSPYFETANNTAPAGLRAGFFQSSDGYQLRYALCSAPQTIQCQGTVIILHGRNEAFEKYYETISDLSRRGFAVATMDWRGQGGSCRLLKDTERGHVRFFSDYVNDFEIFLDSIILENCPPPYYILAHSTGALIALEAHKTLQKHIRRMVLASPFLGLQRRIVSDKRLSTMAYFLASIGFGNYYAGKVPLHRSPKNFSGNRLTHDSARYLRNTTIIHDHPKLGIAGPTIQWIAQTLRAIHKINTQQFFDNYTIPTLMIVAGADRVVDSKTAIRFAQKLRSASVITIDGAYHELFQESDFYREQAWAAFDAFIPGSASKETQRSVLPSLASDPEMNAIK